MESRLVTPVLFRATKLWNEVTNHFRAGMPRRKHRQHFKKYGNCFTASEATDWLHELLKSNNNFGLEVTRQQTVQLLRKFLKNHVIEDIKGRWGSENFDDNNNLYRFPSASPVRSLPNRCPLSENKNIIPKETNSVLKLPHFSRITPKKHEQHVCQENIVNLNSDTVQEDTDKMAQSRRISQADIEEIWRNIVLIHLQTILDVPSLEQLLDPAKIFPQHVIYNMTNTSKRGVVVLQDKSEDLPHWVLSAMKCLANWPRSNDMSQPTYVGFERDVFKTVADYFLSLPEPLLTFEYYELFVNILGLFHPHLERVAIEALQICCLLLPPPSRRKLQLLMRMISRMSENVDMPRLHDTVGTRSLMIQTFSRCVLRCEEEVDLDELLAVRLVAFLMDHHQDIFEVPTYLHVAAQDHIESLKTTQKACLGKDLSAVFPTYSYCKRITTREFDEQKVSTSQAAVAELLESIIKDRNLSFKDKKKKLKRFQKEYPQIYQRRFPTTENEAMLFEDKPTIKQPILILQKPAFLTLRH
ncbi:DEP domain-containing protein 1A isoform X2 [Sphaerodactylus townsendi]|uniref:DEP domain-containing protein 1A isoform X2 n=1 Tax=Sphaerodactylus townsendi TaxID=933632 RepID=UPI002025D90D|nr:DEP domain-containing protein 1A isoform X2 [Sphaerodactylus townsendi]